jgi:hypothetical protein
MCSGRVSCSCSISDTRRVHLVTNPVISHEQGEDREAFTTSGRYPWWFVTQRMEFTFQNSYVIIELAPSTVIFWTELSCWHKNYSNKATLLLGWSHRCKYSKVVITIWLTVTIYQYLKWQYIFNLLNRCFLSSITAKILTGLDYIWVARECLIKRRNCLPFQSTRVHPRFLWWGPCCSSL